MSKGTWVWAVLSVVAFAGLSYLAYVFLQQDELPTGLLYGNGHVEGTEVAVSAQVAGLVVESRLVEGNTVKAGELLVRLDDAELRARLQQVQAEFAALTQNVLRVREEMALWRHHRETAQQDLERTQALRRTGVATPRQLDDAEDRFRETEGRVNVLQAQYAEVQARREAAKAQIELLRLQRSKAEIRSPITGTVLTKAIEVGELAQPGRTVAVLVDLARLDLKVYIAEADIGKVKLGDPAQVKVNAFPDRRFDATVARVEQRAQFTPRDIHLPEERTQMVFGVKLALENPAGALKPGMPADAWIRWAEDVPWPKRLLVPR